MVRLSSVRKDHQIATGGEHLHFRLVNKNSVVFDTLSTWLQAGNSAFVNLTQLGLGVLETACQNPRENLQTQEYCGYTIVTSQWMINILRQTAPTGWKSSIRQSHVSLLTYVRREDARTRWVLNRQSHHIQVAQGQTSSAPCSTKKQNIRTLVQRPTAMSFTLTPAESALRHLLLDVAAYISPPSPSDLRFTGGWVRDKLLGIKSHDIDVGISDMTGYQFGLKLKEYLALPENELKYRAQGVAANLHKIEANPEKSKHLETVTTKIFGLDVDLVNLRKESYTEHSRNPQMAQGTPEEDALRRDATINAMFYNLKTQSVEDFTGLGHEDMKNKVIRTPLEPHQTFKDDPLRVLRLIRFASRFQYDLDPDVEKAMRDFSIRKALRVKISRERVGVEIEKMLKGPHPLLGLSLIHHLNLFETIFVDPHKDYTFKPEVSSWPRAYRAAEEMINESSSRFKALFRGVEDQSYHIWILSAAIPWAEAPQSLPLSSKGRAPSPLGVEAIRNGLKTSNKVTEIIINSFTNSEDIIVSKDSFLQHMRTTQRVAAPGSPTGRDTLGILIRKWGHTWKSQIAFAVMLESMRQTGDDQGTFSLK